MAALPQTLGAESLFDRPLDEGFARTLTRLLEEAFGGPLALWLPGPPWRLLAPDGRVLAGEPPARLKELLEQACEAVDAPTCEESDDGSSVAIPIRRNRELAAVAGGCLPIASRELMKLATAFLRELRLREELESQCAANEVRTTEATRSFEQLSREKDAIFFDTVRALVGAIEAKDPYTRGHSERVGLFARRLGEGLRLDTAACQQLYLCGLLHDVGKIAIQGATLRKPGQLTAQEFQEVQQHPQCGWDILFDLDRLGNVLPAVVHHHEHFDGGGYPDGLARDDIPRDARILAVADTYDALTSNRPYRPGMTQAKAEAVLRQGAGTQWDPVVIDAMLRAMPDMIRIRENYQPRRPPARAAGKTAAAEHAASPAAPTAFSLPTTCLTAAASTQGE